MSRSTKSLCKHKRHRKIISKCKGLYGRSKNCYKIAKKALDHRLANQFISRKQNKRNFRCKFIRIINSYCVNSGIKYSKFIHRLNKSEYSDHLDRKSISIMIQHDQDAFKNIFDEIMLK